MKGKEEPVKSYALSLLPNMYEQQLSFNISENAFRDKATSRSSLDLVIGYSIDYPRKQFQSSIELSQQLCTWAVINCGRVDNEGALHGTQLFASGILPLPTKTHSQKKPLATIKLSEFSNLDRLLPFRKILFLKEDVIIEDGLIQHFTLELSLQSRISGYAYINIPFISHADDLIPMTLTRKG